MPVVVARRRCACAGLNASRTVSWRGEALPCGCLCYLWLQRSLRSRFVFCVMSLMAQGAHRGRPVAAAPCTPGLRPAKSPLRGAFDLSLQASGRAEAASVQNTALSPHPCGLPRPSGNVSAILRPSVPAVSVAQVGKSTTGRTNPPGRVRRSRHPAQRRASVPSDTAALRRRRYSDGAARRRGCP
ncbi:hypothetical protein BANRA_04107 [Klebsiella quasipneumoniae]|nr:hypothetical protein BANRA_04107 [Klebsiella quasipneumoniae]